MPPPPPAAVKVAVFCKKVVLATARRPLLKIAPPAPFTMGGEKAGARPPPAGSCVPGRLAAQATHGVALASAKLKSKLEPLTVAVRLVLNAPPPPPEQLSTKLLPEMSSLFG